ncbi:MAG TPA: serine/threonine-protein kinase, partial [Gemmataceae bacterium]|nr:serine/threonine-protein kinase [Gemmataceae bacterium]
MTPTVDTPAGRDPRPPGKLPPELAACPEYEVLRELGRGGMGVVYLARNRLMSRLEALKIMTGPQRVELFLREIQAAGRLAHPNVAAAYSAVKVGGGLVLAMEYVEGRDLQRQVDARGPLSVAYACECVRQAALGLQHAFDRGIVHRDIKPGNLIATRTAGAVVVKLLDFGVAGVVGEGAEELPLGTPAFAAPEQILDPALADARSDIYALGGTLYFLLTGDHPFPAETSTEVIRRHRHEPPRELSAARPDVPPALAAVVARMLAKDPADRFRSATEVAAALAPFADPQAPPFSGTRPPAPAAPDSVASFAATVAN